MWRKKTVIAYEMKTVQIDVKDFILNKIIWKDVEVVEYMVFKNVWLYSYRQTDS